MSTLLSLLVLDIEDHCCLCCKLLHCSTIDASSVTCQPGSVGRCCYCPNCIRSSDMAIILVSAMQTDRHNHSKLRHYDSIVIINVSTLYDVCVLSC